MIGVRSLLVRLLELLYLLVFAIALHDQLAGQHLLVVLAIPAVMQHVSSTHAPSMVILDNGCTRQVNESVNDKSILVLM